MNTEELRKRINESGIKKARIAGALGISYESLRRKLKSVSEFTASEIGALASLLSLTPEEVAYIFYPSMLN